MMMTEKMIALMINLLLGQITESSTRMRERLKNCDSDKDISMVLVRFLVLVTMMVTKVDHDNHRSNDHGNHRSNHHGYYDGYYNGNT